MEWSTVAGLATVAGILSALIFAAFQILSYGESRGVEKTELRYEVANRKAREEADKIMVKAEAEYDKALDITTNLEFSDVKKLIFNAEDIAEEVPTATAVQEAPREITNA